MKAMASAAEVRPARAHVATRRGGRQARRWGWSATGCAAVWFRGPNITVGRRGCSSCGCVGTVQDETASFRLDERRAIAGLRYGVEGMREGGTRRIRVRPHLAYRDVGVPGMVPQDAVLELHVTLVRVLTPTDDIE